MEKFHVLTWTLRKGGYMIEKYNQNKTEINMSVNYADAMIFYFPYTFKKYNSHVKSVL